MQAKPPIQILAISKRSDSPQSTFEIILKIIQLQLCSKRRCYDHQSIYQDVEDLQSFSDL
jgi:hypothetical protein